VENRAVQEGTVRHGACCHLSPDLAPYQDSVSGWKGQSLANRAADKRAGYGTASSARSVGTGRDPGHEVLELPEKRS